MKVFHFQIGMEEVWMAALNFYMMPRKVHMFPSQSQPDLGGQFFIIRSG